MKELFRAAIMLSVLVGLPTAWMYYGPLPPSAQKVVDRVVEVVKDATGWQQPHCDSFDDKTAPRFAQEPLPTAPVVTPATNFAPPVTEAAPPVPAANLQQQLAPLLQQLQAFGPTDYSLEEWGTTGEFFRFRCAMPLGVQQGMTRQFEAVAKSPADCVRQVIAEIAQWKNSGGTPTTGYSAIASNPVLNR